MGCIGGGGRRNVGSELSFKACVEMTVLFGVVSAQPANPCIERTAGKRCLPVRFGLRPTPAAHAQRYVAAPSAFVAVALAASA